MQILLDTHTFIWFINGDKSLPEKIIADIRDVKNQCFISIASVWEIAIKIGLNKLELSSDSSNIIDFLLENEVEILPITFSHIQVLTTLPYRHRDPFDRMIISQGISENLNILTNDGNFRKYQVSVRW